MSEELTSEMMEILFDLFGRKNLTNLRWLLPENKAVCSFGEFEVSLQLAFDGSFTAFFNEYSAASEHPREAMMFAIKRSNIWTKPCNHVLGQVRGYPIYLHQDEEVSE